MMTAAWVKVKLSWWQPPESKWNYHDDSRLDQSETVMRTAAWVKVKIIMITAIWIKVKLWWWQSPGSKWNYHDDCRLDQSETVLMTATWIEMKLMMTATWIEVKLMMTATWITRKPLWWQPPGLQGSHCDDSHLDRSETHDDSHLDCSETVVFEVWWWCSMMQCPVLSHSPLMLTCRDPRQPPTDRLYSWWLHCYSVGPTWWVIDVTMWRGSPQRLWTYWFPLLMCGCLGV